MLALKSLLFRVKRFSFPTCNDWSDKESKFSLVVESLIFAFKNLAFPIKLSRLLPVKLASNSPVTSINFG